jgi:NAD-dependent deacetylase
MDEAVAITATAEIFAVIGTSLLVYPAAGLVNYAPPKIPKFIIDKAIPYTQSLYNLSIIEKGACEGVRDLKKMLQILL